MRVIGGEGKLTERAGRIGPYRLVQRIGEGGMGVVHLGLDPENRTVAVKVLRPQVAGDATARRRLAREVETMRRVHSPYVAEIVDADVTGDAPYVVTQYVPGHPLDSAVDERGPLRGAALRKVTTGLSSALAAIHGAGIIHRDLKPANVMLVEGSPVVIDFGIAQAVDTTRLTQTGMFIGTPGYLAPEVIQGGDVGPASDIHALASTLLFAATGHPPFGSGGFEQIFFKILQGQPDLAGVPMPLVPVLRQALARDPRDRPDAAELVRRFGELDLRDDTPLYHPGDDGDQPADGAAHAAPPADPDARHGGAGALGAGLAGGAAGLAAGAALGGLADHAAGDAAGGAAGSADGAAGDAAGAAGAAGSAAGAAGNAAGAAGNQGANLAGHAGGPSGAPGPGGGAGLDADGYGAPNATPNAGAAGSQGDFGPATGGPASPGDSLGGANPGTPGVGGGSDPGDSGGWGEYGAGAGAVGGAGGAYAVGGPRMGSAAPGGPGPMDGQSRTSRIPRAGDGADTTAMPGTPRAGDPAAGTTAMPGPPYGGDNAPTAAVPGGGMGGVPHAGDDAPTSAIPGGAQGAGPPPSEPGPDAEFPTAPNGRGMDPGTRPYTRQAGYDDYRDVLSPVEYARPQAPPAAPYGPPQRPVATAPPEGYPPRDPRDPRQAPPGWGPDGYGDPRRRPPSEPRAPGWHPLLSLLVGVVAIAGSVVFPTIFTCIVVIALVLLRATDHASKSLAVRRSARGPKGSDAFLVALGTPWGLVRGALIQVLMLPLAAIVAGIVFGVLVYLKPDLPSSTLAGYAAGAFVLMLVLGPGSGSPRRGLNRTVGVFARGGASTAIVSVVLCLAALFSVVGATTQEPSWQPVHVTHKSPNELVDQGSEAAHDQAVHFIRRVVKDMLGKTFG